LSVVSYAVCYSAFSLSSASIATF